MELETYGITGLPHNATQADVELVMAFNTAMQKSKMFMGAYEHLHLAIDLIWNEPRRKIARERKSEYDPRKHDVFIWNDWTERMMRAFAENREVIIAGSASSWKTTSMALFFLCMWLYSPNNTRIILTSTTGDGLRARIWKELVHFWRFIPIGNLVQSRTMIQFQKGDDGAGIFGIAVEADGNIDKAVNKIIGRHNTNMGIGVDEMPTVSPAIVEAGVNLETGAERFQFGGVGNPDNRFDPHGQMAEPKDGWGSITDETEQWKTKRGGLALHLDGRRSPRIGNEEYYPGMICQRDIDRTADRYGENSPLMWKQRIGFWAPDGLTKTVLTESLIIRSRAQEKAVWVGDYITGACLDPSFEGEDRCVLRFPRCGQIDGGMTVISWAEPPIIIKVDITSKDPVHYQILHRVREECISRHVPPDMFALDSTGEGGGLASIFMREWSPNILLVEFGGRPSTDPLSDSNPKRADLEYDRKITELCFRFQILVQNGQVRDLDVETAKEFCNRHWDLKGNLVAVETKEDMKKLTGRSCDLLDNAIIGAELFRKRGKLGRIGKSDTVRSTAWKDAARKYAIASTYE